jgi:(1->4)-alpha-D-glucan 1-alpha-D-glucosylmutase
VQLRGGFGFSDAADAVAYLSRLGVSHIYCSPYLQAARGSTHGYDIVNFHRLNEELGGARGLAQMTAALHAHGMGQVADVVPNHMATGGRANDWWWDVLEDGPSSPYAKYFDIDWQGPDESSRQTVLAPYLQDQYGRVVDAGEIAVAWEADSFVVRYHEYELPLSPRTFDEILEPVAHQLESSALADLVRAFAALPHAARSDPASSVERHGRKRVLGEQLRGLCAEDPSIGPAIDAELSDLNRDPARLDGLLRRQNYRLAFWRTAAEELDYRRFFNIETLVGLRVELDQVFGDTHREWLRLVAAGTVDGLRVDHVDGLRDPAQYLERLQAATKGTYTVVEKILAAEEDLPTWPVSGTTGYDFLNRVNNLFVETANEGDMTRCYGTFTGDESTYAEVVSEAKQQVLSDELASEVGRLTTVLLRVCGSYRRQRDRTRREVRAAVEEMLVAFPVYRTYVRSGQPATESDRVSVAAAVERAAARRPDLDPELLSFLGELLLLAHEGSDDVEFALRFAQVSGPVTAKGVEDTAFYRYNRLISLNEVGGTPDVFGRSVAQFHARTRWMAEKWPDSMLTISTHDTKRSADVRARINLLSEIPKSWNGLVTRLAEINEPHRQHGWPDRNAEYLLYQTAVGAWPISAERLLQFMSKATKEAKVHTSWVDPVPEYDAAVVAFVRDIMANREFPNQIERFLDEHSLIELGRVNALAQTTLLLTCPGVADIYQGSELWDLSLVDPDNRRPVDYRERNELLARLTKEVPSIPIGEDDIGVWKQWLIWRLLQDRQARPEAYGSSQYEPLEVKAPIGQPAVAFVRGDLAVIVPRLLGRPDGVWRRSDVFLGASDWINVLTGEHVTGGRVPLSDVLARCPVAVLTRRRA